MSGLHYMYAYAYEGPKAAFRLFAINKDGLAAERSPRAMIIIRLVSRSPAPSICDVT